MDFHPSFLQIPYLLVPNKNIQPTDLIVYGIIYWYEKMKEGRCFASNETIAKYANCTESCAAHSIKRLKEEGYIKCIYKDKSERNRTEIRCLVDYKKQVVSTNELTTIVQMSNRDSTNEQQIENTNKDKILGEVRTSQTFDGFLKSRGYKLVDKYVGDGGMEPVLCWPDTTRPLTPAAIDNLRWQYNKKVGKKEEETKPEDKITAVFKLFAIVNPAWITWKVNKTQRRAVENLTNEYSLEEIDSWLKKAWANKSEYAIQVLSPDELFKKMAKLKAQEEKKHKKAEEEDDESYMYL